MRRAIERITALLGLLFALVAVLASTSLAAVGAEAHAYTYDPSIRAYDVSPRVTPSTDVSELKQRPSTPPGSGAMAEPGPVIRVGLAAKSAGAAELSGGMRALLAQRAGFSGTGTRIIVDENLPSAWSAGLREAGYDARSVSEMGLRGASALQLSQLADQVGARVLTRDVGHDGSGGFGSNGVVIDSRVRSLDTVLRILGGE